VLLAPLTPDREALGDLLEALDTDWVHPAGSNLAAGIRAALEAFAADGERPRLILALSDGEDPRARRDLGAAEARRAGVRVLAAALGTETGAGVPDRGAALRDAAGREVVSRRRLQRLARLAEETGGQVFPGDAWGELDLERLLAALRRDARAAGDARAWQTLPDVPVLPLAAAGFVLLLAEAWPRPPRRAAARLATLGLTALLGLGAAAAESGDGEEASGIRALEARLRARPGDPRLLLHLGLARLESGRADAAARAFAAAAVAARDPELAALAYHDLGVAQLEIGALGAARDAFLDALALAPDDSQARFNLEWTVRALAAAPHGRAAEPPRPETRPPDAPEAPGRGAEPRRAGRDPAPLDPQPAPGAEQRRRLLEQVGDDPARALRGAAGPGRLRRPAGPAW
jgi:tetratricopeptide (TPR) repeat protein